MRLDHVSYACAPSEIADVVQRIGSDLGVTFVDGGRHPSFGTRNFTAALANGCYIEVVCALDHPAALKAPFGRIVEQRASAGGGWLGWVVAVPDIAVIEAGLGRASVSGHRIRPDGTQLRWKQIGVLDTLSDPAQPFFIEWVSPESDHPAARGGSVTIASFECSGDPASSSTPSAISNHLVVIDWIDDDEPGLVAIWFDTAHGRVRID